MEQSRCYVNLASAAHDLRGLPAASFAPGLSPDQPRVRRFRFVSWRTGSRTADGGPAGPRDGAGWWMRDSGGRIGGVLVCGQLARLGWAVGIRDEPRTPS